MADRPAADTFPSLAQGPQLARPDLVAPAGIDDLARDVLRSSVFTAATPASPGSSARKVGQRHSDHKLLFTLGHTGQNGVEIANEVGIS